MGPFLFGTLVSIVFLVVLVRLVLSYSTPQRHAPAGLRLPNLSALGFQVQRSGQRALFWTGQHRGRQVRISHDYSEPAEFRVMFLAQMPFQGHLRRQTEMTDLRVAHGLGQDLSLGDPGLDEALELDFPDEPEIQAFLDHPSTRGILRELATDPALRAGFIEFSFEPTALTSRWKMDFQTAEQLLPKILETHHVLSEAAVRAKMVQIAEAGAPGAGFEAVIGAPGGSGTPAATPFPPAAAPPPSTPAEPPPVSQQTPYQEPSAAAPGPEPSPPALGEAQGSPPAGAEPAVEPSASAAPGQPAPAPPLPEPSAPKVDIRELLEREGPEAAARAARTNPEAISDLAGCLGDFGRRGAAVQALRLLGADALPALLEAARDVLAASAVKDVLAEADGPMRQALAQALESARDRRELEFLLDVAERLRLTEARAQVEKLASHEDFLLRLKAESVLRNLEAAP